MENTKEKINNYQKYIVYFFLFALLGWLMETIYSFIVLGHFTKRGFLYGPICPIYGYGALILIIVLEKFKKNPIKLFVYSSVIFSTLEYLASYILEVMFNSYWWNYSTDFLNLNGRIALFYAVAWGFIALIFINIIFPFIQKKLDSFSQKIPYKVFKIFLNILIVVYIVDTACSCVGNSFLS